VRDEDMMMLMHQLLAPQASVLMLSQQELARFADCWRDHGVVDQPAGRRGRTDRDRLRPRAGDRRRRRRRRALQQPVRRRRRESQPGLGQHLPGPFVGAGTTLSAALAASMARGATAVEALAAAQDYTNGALQHACRFGMGRLIPNKLFRVPAGAC
jgi:hydroxymethylpyrimidine/phosphomethylpyrimidine kinase